MANKITKEIDESINSKFEVPNHVMACASAIRYDIFNGPSYSAIPDNGIEGFTVDHYSPYPEDLTNLENCTIEETYTGIVAETLRQYIADLPSELWYDSECGNLLESEPESWYDEDENEWIEPEWSDYFKVDRNDIVKALFGSTISREFR